MKGNMNTLVHRTTRRYRILEDGHVLFVVTRDVCRNSNYSVLTQKCVRSSIVV